MSKKETYIFTFQIKKKTRNVHTLTVVWTRQGDYSNDNRLFSRHTLEYRMAHNNFLSNWLAANDDRTTTTSCISTKYIKVDTAVGPNQSFISSSSSLVLTRIKKANLWCNDLWCTHRKGQFNLFLSIYISLNAAMIITYWIE